MTSADWVPMGPTLTASRRPWALARKVTAWPAAGASTTTKSTAPATPSVLACSICLILPSTRMSLIPGMAVAITSRVPVEVSRLDIRRMPWSSRYSRRASSGVRVRAGDGATPARRGLGGGDEDGGPVGEVVGAAEHDRQPALALHLDDEGVEPGAGRHQGQGPRNGRLADPAFAGDDHHPSLRAERTRVHVPPWVRGRPANGSPDFSRQARRRGHPVCAGRRPLGHGSRSRQRDRW